MFITVDVLFLFWLGTETFSDWVASVDLGGVIKTREAGVVLDVDSVDCLESKIFWRRASSKPKTQ